MDIQQHHDAILSLADSHPAKRFLVAFLQCKDECVGQHHLWTEKSPIEQAWVSSDGKKWLFSDFAYEFLSLDLVLEGPNDKDSEQRTMQKIQLMRSLIKECSNAAKNDGNIEILKLTERVIQMLRLWEEFIQFCRPCT